MTTSFKWSIRHTVKTISHSAGEKKLFKTSVLTGIFNLGFQPRLKIPESTSVWKKYLRRHREVSHNPLGTYSDCHGSRHKYFIILSCIYFLGCSTFIHIGSFLWRFHWIEWTVSRCPLYFASLFPWLTTQNDSLEPAWTHPRDFLKWL